MRLHSYILLQVIVDVKNILDTSKYIWKHTMHKKLN